MTDDALLDEILAAETQVWEALATGDAAADLRALAADFVGLYATGFADRAEHAAQLDGGPVVGGYEIREARLVPAGAGHVLLLYRALFTRPDGAAQDWYISSLWRRTEEGWENTFSQDTPAAP